MVRLLSAEIFRQCGSTALQRKPFANRYSTFAACLSSFTIRQLLIAIRCRFGSAGASPSRFAPVPRLTTLVLLKVGARFLPQIMKSCSMVCLCLRHQLWAKVRSMGILGF